MSNHTMLSNEDLQSMAQQVRSSHPKQTVCYIAIIDMRATDGSYSLEVEVNEGSIGASMLTGTRSLKKARVLANRLEKHLIDLGIHVMTSRDEWEDWLLG